MIGMSRRLTLTASITLNKIRELPRLDADVVEAGSEMTYFIGRPVQVTAEQFAHARPSRPRG